MALATLGDIVFSVSFDDQAKVFTFDELTRSNKNRFAKHDVIGAKPITEKIGPDLGEMKFQMILSASLGINPKKTMDQFYTAFNNSTPMTFMLGGAVVGNYKWIISEFEESYQRIDNRGNVWEMKINVSLQEYVETLGDKTAVSAQTTQIDSTGGTVSNVNEKINGLGDGGENPTES